MIRCVFIFLALLWTLAADAQSFWIGQVAGTAAHINTNSPIGTNFQEPFADGTTAENPFLNMFKLGGGWTTATAVNADTGEETTFEANCADGNHFLNVSPASCATNFGTTFTLLRTVLFSDQGATYNYPAGNYVFLWDGNSDANFTFGARDPTTATSCPLSGHPNRVVIASNSPATGIEVRQTSIGTGGSYPTNIRLVNATAVMPGDVQSTCATIGTREALMHGGEDFDPQFVSQIKFYSVLRFMKWQNILFNSTVNWADRPLKTWAFWNENNTLPSGAATAGVPFELDVELCNEVHADCYINTPYLFTSSAMTSLATMVFNNLNSSLRAYTEMGNEWFNIGAVGGNVLTPAEAAGNSAFPCSANNNPADTCPSGTGSVSGSVLTISTTNVNEWLAGTTIVSDGTHTATITSNGTGSGGTGTYNLSNSTLTGTSFTGVSPGSGFQKWFNFGALQAARNAQAWAAVWPANRLFRVLGGDFGFTSRTQYHLDYQDTFNGGVTCAGCSGNTWSGKLATQVDYGTTAPYFPAIDWFVGCPIAWTADGDGGVNRCTTEYTTGGNLSAPAAVTTTHTTDSLNACSVATGKSANHYSATVSGLGTISNGKAVSITFDTATIGPCDDLNINGTTGLLQADLETWIQDDSAQSAPAAISGTTLTVTNNNLNFVACCGPTVMVGGTITGSSASAGTFVAALGTGTGYSGTYTVNNSQSVTCNPCYIGNPADSNQVPGAGCNQSGGHCTGGPWLLVFTNATSVGSMPASWRVECTGGGCLEQSGGWIAGALAEMTGDINLITGAPYNLKYLNYEQGLQAASCCRGDEKSTLLLAMYRGSSMGTMQAAYLNGFRGAGLNGPTIHFNYVFGPESDGLAFGTLESSREATSPEFNATKTYATGTACWWSGCAIPP